MGRLGKQRKKLWDQDPHCHWCGRLTRLMELGGKNGRHQPDDMATIDHLHSRFSKNRKTPCSGEIRRVIACYRCNHDRGAKEQAEVPAEELQRRSQQHEKKKINKLINNGAKLDWMKFMRELEGLSLDEKIKKVDEIYEEFFTKADVIEESVESHDVGDLGFLIKAETALKKARRHVQFLQKLRSDLTKQERIRQTEEENKRFERLFMWTAKEMLPAETYNAIMDATRKKNVS